MVIEGYAWLLVAIRLTLLLYIVVIGGYIWLTMHL